MRLRYLAVFSLAVSYVLVNAPSARAQQLPWGDLTASLVRIDYDLSGTGAAPGVAIRATRNLSPALSFEFGGVFARPNQQFGPSSLFLPEAQLRHRWTVGRVSPYVGGGVGAALVKSSFHSDWDPTLSLAGGSAVRLNDRLAVNGELRLRGHEWGFTGTTAELSAGLSWQLPAF